jgi:hypothetical protein
MLRMDAAAAAVIFVLLTIVWAITSRGFFWPLHALLPLAVGLAIHAWIVAMAERPRIRERFLGSEALALHVGVAASLWLYLFALWRLGIAATSGRPGRCSGSPPSPACMPSRSPVNRRSTKA